MKMGFGRGKEKKKCIESLGKKRNEGESKYERKRKGGRAYSGRLG